jgi:hypothetical protein
MERKHRPTKPKKKAKQQKLEQLRKAREPKRLKRLEKLKQPTQPPTQQPPEPEDEVVETVYVKRPKAKKVVVKQRPVRRKKKVVYRLISDIRLGLFSRPRSALILSGVTLV